MRTCDAVGIQDVYILNNRIPPQKKWGYRSSSTATEWLTIHQFTNVEECFKEVRKKYKRIYATHLSEESIEIYSFDFTESIAIVFGNETFGVSDEISKFTDGSLLIPQVGIIKSLNISVACAITLYEAFRQKRLKDHYLESRMSEVNKAAIKEKWNLPG